MEKSEAEDWNALGERIAMQAVHLDMATHRLLSDLRRFDESCAWHAQGFLSCAHWLSFRVGWDLATSRERVRVAKSLGGLPKVEAELASGKLSYCKARAISRVATPKLEETLLAYAAVCSGSQLETICRKYRAVEKVCVDPRAAPPQNDERFITSSKTSTGMVCVKAVMRADEASLLMEVVQAAAKASKTEGSTARFNRVDGLMSILQDYARGERPQRTPVEMIITTPAEALHMSVPSNHNHDASSKEDCTPLPANHDHDASAEARNTTSPIGSTASATSSVASEQDRGGSVPVAIVATTDAYLDPETTRRLACDCGIVEATVSPRGEPLSVGRKSRTIPAALKRALSLRDRTCRFPGCDHRLFLDGHHIRHWADGGETGLGNTMLLCSTHHSYVHERGYRIVRSEAGDITFLDPRGKQVRAVAPRPDPVATEPSVSAEAQQTQQTQRAPGSGGRLDLAEAIGRLMKVQGLRAPLSDNAVPIALTVDPAPSESPREKFCFGDPDYNFIEWGQRPYDLEKWATETILATGEDPTATVPAPVWPPVSWYLSKGREPPKSMDYRPTKNTCSRRPPRSAHF